MATRHSTHVDTCRQSINCRPRPIQHARLLSETVQMPIPVPGLPIPGLSSKTQCASSSALPRRGFLRESPRRAFCRGFTTRRTFHMPVTVRATSRHSMPTDYLSTVTCSISQDAHVRDQRTDERREIPSSGSPYVVSRR